ncbi:hypothetical protein M422DRAFT_260615 [Sphaerobolus stellatus SS14]|uniref:Uncharacterized protein n=1 Tax=Sphaerobolus stellatus (strain SS14) TaxID=990650 RepID=A0A0C9VI83_SPHS4|nr:hypothetical protein M422DRAFT_260615 [Sphaerobolus stellatus SS14]
MTVQNQVSFALFITHLGSFVFCRIVPHLRIRKAARRELTDSDQFWITTPNMSFIPEAPNEIATPIMASDGRLGVHEWSEHPRRFLPHRPHESMLALSKPDQVELNFLTCSLCHTDLVPCYPEDQDCSLFNLCAELCERVVLEYRLIEWAMRDLWKTARDFTKLPRDSKTHEWLTRCHLTKMPMLWKHAVWEKLLRKQEATVEIAQSVDITRRGCFTGDELVVKMLVSLGIPVWHIRHMKRVLDLGVMCNIQPASLNPLLQSPPCPAEWEIPDIFRQTFHEYADWGLSNSKNGASHVSVPPRTTMNVTWLQEQMSTPVSPPSSVCEDSSVRHRSSPDDEPPTKHQRQEYQDGGGSHMATGKTVSRRKGKSKSHLGATDSPMLVTALRLVKGCQESPPRDPPEWQQPNILGWAVTQRAVKLNEAQVQEVFKLAYFTPDLEYKLPCPPPHFFYPSAKQCLYLHNWVRASELWFYSMTPNVDKPLAAQNTQCWRGTLADHFGQKELKAFKFQEMLVTGLCHKEIPPVFALQWRHLRITNGQQLSSPLFLKVLVWELQELSFLVALLALDKRLTNRSHGDPIHLQVFNEWHGLPSVRPRFEGPRVCEYEDWYERRYYIGSLIDMCFEWPGFVKDLMAWQTYEENRFLQAEKDIMVFILQTHADVFLRLMPLPAVRPELPQRL